jgi:hypothetical protein
MWCFQNPPLRSLTAPGYDQLAEQRFEFIPLWGFLVYLRYTMRRVDCRRCGVVPVEEVPWGDGKRTLTKAYMLFLARWARRCVLPAQRARGFRHRFSGSYGRRTPHGGGARRGCARSGPHSVLVEPGNHRALAEALETLYRRPDLRQTIAAAGAAPVEQCDAPRVAGLFLAELERLANRVTMARGA